MSGKKNYPISIGDKVYQFRYTFDALTTIEDLTGKEFNKVLQSSDLKTWKFVMFAGLNANHPEIPLEKVGALVDEADSLGQLKREVQLALLNSIGVGKPATDSDVKKKDPEPSATATGA